MAYKLFVSHSFLDTALVDTLQSLRLPGIELYIAEADPQYGDSLSEKIEGEIDASDAVVVFLTKRGGGSASVNQEVGYAKKAHKRIIALVEEGATVGVLIQGLEIIHFSVGMIEDAVQRVTRFVTPKAKEKRRIQLFWIGLLVVVVALIFVWIGGAVVSTLRKRKSPNSSTRNNDPGQR